ncbi:MAG: aldo/keto reductase [Chloroflexota bacterium]|nr:aldo/keto reductase [Chloroflexota bacterium]
MTASFLRSLGKTELKVSPIGLGCWQFSKGKGLTGRYWSVLSDDDIAEIVKLSLDGGINWFDSAEAYGSGESERALARALKRLDAAREDVVIATKWWPLLRSARSLINSIDERLDALGVSQIDLYQIHQRLSRSSVNAEMRSMAKLVDMGKIRSVGISNYSADDMRAAHNELQMHGLTLASNQVKFNLLDRRIESNGILDKAKELGITVIAYSPLAQGLLTGKYHQDPDRLKDVRAFRKIYKSYNRRLLDKTRPIVDVLQTLAEKYQVSAAQIALNWVINVHGDTVVAIAGASKPSHAADNVGAMKFKLSDADMALLDRVSYFQPKAAS